MESATRGHESHVDGPFYDVGDHGPPNDWALLAYDAPWLFAKAIHNLTARGISPFDGAALKQQLLHTTLDGASGPLRFNPATQVPPKANARLSRVGNVSRFGSMLMVPRLLASGCSGPRARSGPCQLRDCRQR